MSESVKFIIHMNLQGLREDSLNAPSGKRFDNNGCNRWLRDQVEAMSLVAMGNSG